MFDSGTGYAYKYNPKTNELKDITPTTTSNGTATKLNVGYGAVASDPKDANKLVATTCAQWYSQSWTADAWDRDAIAWGDRFADCKLFAGRRSQLDSGQGDPLVRLHRTGSEKQRPVLGGFR